MAKNGTVYKKSGGIYHPLTNTHQVLNPDGSRLEERLTDDEQAVKGKGSKASAKEYPFRFIGEYNSIAALNTALDAIFSTTDEKYQGSLRARLNGQTVFIQQIGIFISRGDWAQVVLGLVAPSQDGTLLTTSGTPNVLWRSRDTGNSTVVSHNWQTIASVNLKTVNGQSLIGEGDISVSGSGGTITVDSDLDPTSTNPVQNKKVYAAIYALQQAISALPDSSAEGGVIVCKQWAELFIAGNEGDYAYNTSRKTIHKYTSGSWVEQESHPQAGVIYINALAHSSYYWNGTDMVSLLGDAPLSAINMNSSSPVNSKAVADYVEGEKKVVNCQHWGSSLPASSADGNYGYDTTNNVIKRYSDSTSSWESLGEPKESVLYKNPNDGHLYHYEEDLMKMVIDGTDIVDEIPSSGGSSSIPTAAAVRGYVTKDTSIPSSDPSTTKVPTTKAVKDYVDNAVQNAGGSSDTSESSDNVKGFGAENYGDPLFPEYYLPVTYNGSSVLLGTLYNSSVAAEKAAADAFIETIKWGVNFYDWPLRCYNGMVSGVTTQSTGAEDIEVFAPSERILFFPNNVPVQPTAANVVLYIDANDNNKSKFLLIHDNVYYSSWSNSDEWNDKDGYARRDCVFSDISIATGCTSKSVRTSKVYGFNGSDDNSWVDITSLMTDFGVAIKNCLAANNGNMRLSDRIYFAIRNANSSLEETLQFKTNFLVDGGKGILFYKCWQNNSKFDSDTTNRSGDVFCLKAVENCTLQNITLRALRDYDNHDDSQQGVEFSCSDSLLNAFGLHLHRSGDPLTIDAAPRNVIIKNVDLQGFNSDFSISSGITASSSTPYQIWNVIIDGWKSRQVWGNTMKGKNVTIRNADVIQRDYPSMGQHIFYGQGGLEGLFVSNSRFEAGKYACAGMLTFHGENCKGGIHFVNCLLIGEGILHGNTYGSTDTFNVYLHGCTLVQRDGKAVSNHNTWGDFDAINVGKDKWFFSNCHFSLINGLASDDAAGSRLELVDCTAVSKSAVYLVSLSYAKCYVDKLQSTTPFKSSTSNVYGPVTDENVKDKVEGAMLEWKTAQEDTLSNITGALFGEGNDANYVCADEDSKPVNARVDETCFVISSGKKYECITAAVLTRITLYIYVPDSLMLSDEMTNLEFSVPIVGNRTLEQVTESVAMTLSVGQETSVGDQTLKAAVSAMAQTYLASNGYSYSILKEGHSNNGYSTVYLLITAKTYGDAYLQYKTSDFVYIVGSSSNTNGVNISARAGKSSYKTNYIPYSPPNWEEIPGGSSDGLDSRVTKLEAKVQPSFSKVGSFENAPDLEEVGDGFCYFDTTHNKPIWSSSSAGTGNTPAWVYADGTVVS